MTPTSSIRAPHARCGERSAHVLAYVDVLHALSDLDRVDRAALRLIYWYGRSQAQVAAELHLPLDTVRAAIARGMNQIADYLTETGSPTTRC